MKNKAVTALGLSSKLPAVRLGQFSGPRQIQLVGKFLLSVELRSGWEI